MTKTLVLSITAKDCRWAYTVGTGKGGQKKQKTSSAVHCIHDPSGAHGYAEETRSQFQNKKSAFDKMVATKKFQDWLKLEVARKTGKLIEIEESVERKMKQIRVEVQENGKWVEVDKQDTLDDTNN